MKRTCRGCKALHWDKFDGFCYLQHQTRDDLMLSIRLFSQYNQLKTKAEVFFFAYGIANDLTLWADLVLKHLINQSERS